MLLQWWDSIIRYSVCWDIKVYTVIMTIIHEMCDNDWDFHNSGEDFNNKECN